MPKAQCYYEILGVEETATSDEIKKAYRNLALVWHPDKNQANLDEAHEKFQSILKAYETLSDSRERDWYDRHRDQILSGGDKDEENNLENLFQYYSSSCYSNFDDSENGFYTVYRNVFEEIAKEEERTLKRTSNKTKQNKSDLSTSYPSFGNSKSDYDEEVKHFYAFWSGFCTNMSFDHLDKYNTTEAENRRILRAMEKENKKAKELAKKERNANVRKLVEFIKKRDKRLKEHKLLVEQQNELNRQKTAAKQRQQREKSLKESTDYKPTVWDNMDDIEEQLRQLENDYDGQSSRQMKEGDENVDNEEEEFDLFCPACNKDFRSVKAFENHEASKKHKQNVTRLTKQLQRDEGELNK